MHAICEGLFLGPVFDYRNQRKEDFQYFWQSVSRENEALENFKLLRTDEGEELYNVTNKEQTKNRNHFLCVSHVRRNIEKNLWIRDTQYVKTWYVGKNSGEKGLINEESLEDYDECLVSLIKKWNEIEQYHTKNEPPRNFATFLLREHGIRGTRGTQNYIEWVNSLSENEIRADDENWRKCITIHKAISCLKYWFLRLYKNADKALYEEGKYKLSGD